MFSTSDKKSAGGNPVAPAKKDSDKPAEPAPNPVWQSLALNSAGIQAKLTVGQTDDPYEQEADRVADQLMRMAISGAPSPIDRPSLNVQRKYDGSEDESEKLQRSSEGNAHQLETPAPSVVHETLKSVGRPLDPALRNFFEPRFGHDLSSVRVHTDSLADESAQAVQARAYTVRDHIAFRAGSYSPDSEAGRTLVAHELTHVVQQGSAAPVKSGARGTDEHQQPVAGRNGESLVNAVTSPPTRPANGKSQLSSSSPTGVPHANGNGNAPVVSRADSARASREVSHEPEQAQSILPAIRPSWSLPLSTIAPAVQRSPDDPKKGLKGGAVVDEIYGDIRLLIWPDQGLMTLSLAGEPWVTVRWTPGVTTLPNIKLTDNTFPDKILVEVDASYQISVTVSTNTERAYASRLLAGAVFGHKYTARGHSVAINAHLPEGKLLPIYVLVNEYEGHPLKFNDEGLPIEPAPALKVQPFWWEFTNVEQLDLMAAAHPQFYWIGLKPEEGKMRALHYTEEKLQEALVGFREDEEVAASVFKFYENGTAWTDLDPLYYMFFGYPGAAEVGAPGDAPECIIFTHGKQSYGRFTVSHDEALNAWLFFENYATTNGADSLADLEIEHFGKFHELIAAGKTNVWDIDLEYFRLRDVLLANASLLKQDAGSDWDDLFKEDLSVWEHYARRALDRDEAYLDPELAAVIDSDPAFVSEAGERIYERVASYATLTARSAVGGVMSGVKEFLDDDKLRSVVLGYPFFDQMAGRRLLTFMGLSENFGALAGFILRDAEHAQLVAMGEWVWGVSLETLKSAVQTHFDELQKTYYELEGANVLEMEGEFGDEIRKVTYEHFGFDLYAQNYPHEAGAEARAGVGRQRVAGSSIYGTEAGFLFATEAAARARRERNIKYLKIALVVVASVALVIVSAGAGLAVAGIAISAETAGAAFLAFSIEVVVSAAIVTAVGPAVNTFIMSGGSLDPALYKKAYSGLGWQFLMNVATFGFFKGLSVGIEAATLAGAGVKSASSLSTGWKAVNVTSRITLSGSAMFGISMVSHRLESGKWPEGESLNEVLFETGLSILLLEVGSSLTRPSMLKIQDWARTQRIGADVVLEMKSLRADITTLNMAAAKYGADPIGKKQTGMDLLTQQEALLNRQKSVIEGLKKSFRTRPDAKGLETMLAPELAEINARLAEIRGVVAFGKAEVQPAAFGGAGDVAEFTYKRGTEKVLKDYFGEKNVIDVGGHLEVMTGGPTGKKLIFRPATNVAGGILPDGTRSPDALIAWRRNATSRIHEILAGAEKLAAHDEVLREVANSDPSTMDAAAAAKFEAKLVAAEKALLALQTKAGPVKTISVERDGETLESWRLRLVIERQNLINRAKLLGLENDPLVKTMSSLPMGRSADPAKKGSLTEGTIKNYRDAVDQVQKLLTKGRVDKLAALDQMAGGPAETPTAVKDKLVGRRSDVLQRAKLFGTTSSKYTLDVKKLNIGSGRTHTQPTKKYSDLTVAERYSEFAAVEEIIARAEIKLDALAKKALDNAVTTYGGAAIAELRAGAGLEKLTDAQVGDVMRQLGTHKLSPEALRGALLAAYAAEAITPISIKRVVSLSRNAAELEFMLTSFGMCRDAQVGGVFRLMRDGVAGGDKWVGTVWQMKLARTVVGIENIRSFEVAKTTGTGNRVIDILLLNGRTVEAKDWVTWLPDKVQEQFFKDLEINTVDGTVASGMEKIRWLFREPAPVSIKEIRATMKTALEDFIVKKGLSKDKADALRDAFDAHSTLVEAVKLDLPSVKPPVDTPKKVDIPPPPTRKDDEE